MARLPEEQIERIKQDISLLRLVESQGYALSKQGKDYAVSCPFHEEKTPSCIISPKSNLYHCFGCGAAGSVIDWVMHSQGLKFREAAVWLSNECLPFEIEAKPEIKKEPEPSPLAANLVADLSINSEEDDQALLHRVINFYHETLKQNQEALDYLEARGLNHPELINTFKLGYANRTLGKQLPNKRIKAGAEIRTQLENLGIYRESGHEHFNGSLVIPIVNQQNEVAEIYGRKILNTLRKGTPKHLYLPGPHAGVFNSECLASPEIILCESLIDALTFWHHGFKNVTTSYGTEGFTNELFTALKENKIQRVLIAYDRDEAGNLAAEKHAKPLMEAGIDCYRVLFPKGMDANEYALKISPPRKSLELVIRKAEWLGSGNDPRKENDHPPLAAELAADLPIENVELPATPIPKNTAPEVPTEISENETVINLENRRYRVRGLHKATSYEQLKINLCASAGELLHVDQLDLYNAKHRQSFIKQTAIELNESEEVIKKDIAKVLLKLEQLQDEQIQETVTPKEKTIELNNQEQEDALELLRDPSLLSRLLEDFDRAGVVGEETNKLVGYLAAVSRKLENPLAVIIQSTSAAGKSALMNAVLAMVPEEERIQYSAMTGQSLFYMGETNLKHKILAIAEEEGADQASYALKLLQSEGELTIASTGKDADGNLTTQEYRVEGPVMLFSTTTAIDIDEELMNRCLVLTVNESREQTQLIHQLQRERETLEGLLAKEDKQAILTLHRNAQRLLKTVRIVNPYATQLTFMDNQTRSRRDHMKYLQLIKTITLLHQYQRDRKVVNHNGNELEYIEVALSDIETANNLAHDILGRSLDELPPQTRKLLTQLHQWVEKECKQQKRQQNDFYFSRKMVRENTGWGDTQLKIHLTRLVELEYLLLHKRGQKFFYELQYSGEGDNGKMFLMNLIETEKLQYDANRSGQKAKQSGRGRPAVGTVSVGGRSDKNGQGSLFTEAVEENKKENGKTHKTLENTTPSYVHDLPSLAAQSRV